MDGKILIKTQLPTVPTLPGVYRMLDEKGSALYIGKAKNLKKRLIAYTSDEKHPWRIRMMLSYTRSLELTTTRNEAEALLLEANLIKKLQPRYNILLRDDKSFPFIRIRKDHDFPQILKYRGAKTGKDEYFGPFASTGAVNETLELLQRVFLLRPCTDHYFATRQRACLQYQIKRCSGPCVGKISKEAYAARVLQAKKFLSGESRDVQRWLQEEMEHASQQMAYEKAAQLRDQIAALTSIQQEQKLAFKLKDADIFGFARKGKCSAISLHFVRGGQYFGSKSYFPQHAEDDFDSVIMAGLLGQIYQRLAPPPLIISSVLPDEHEVLEEALSNNAGYKVVFHQPKQGEKKAETLRANQDAEKALEELLEQRVKQDQLLEQLATRFQLAKAPERIEVYDNSHLFGTNRIGAMIVASPEGFEQRHYRKFNIKGPVNGGDDYAMMREVLIRRFARSGEWTMPDLLLIDGGAGQLSAAREALKEAGLDQMPIIAISKGIDRNAGREFFHMEGQEAFQLPPNDSLLHYLQRLRDEAHRFAIGTHRKKRGKSIRQSSLDEITGIGSARKKALLLHFGSAKGVESASLEALADVEGIDRKTAEKVYAYFHG